MTAIRYAACYAAYLHLPLFNHNSRAWFLLLPYAGEYAFNEGGYIGFARNFREMRQVVKSLTRTSLEQRP